MSIIPFQSMTQEHLSGKLKPYDIGEVVKHAVVHEIIEERKHEIEWGPFKWSTQRRICRSKRATYIYMISGGAMAILAAVAVLTYYF